VFVGPIVEVVVEAVDVVLVALLDERAVVEVPFTPIQTARVASSVKIA
jgi:hypothetical protein